MPQNKLMAFNYQEKQMRTVEIGGETWFVAKDVCDILELDDTGRAIDRLDPDESTRIEIDHPQSPGKTIQAYAVNEAGLYGLILGSRKPEAAKFKRWVTHDVVPSIRKHGAYMTPETIEKTLTDPDFIIGLATKLKEERELRVKAEEHLKIAVPKEKFADACMASKDCVKIRDVAKIASNGKFVIGEKRLFKLLRQWKVLNDENIPYQCYIDRGYFKLVQRHIDTYEGVLLKFTTYVLPKGQIYIINRLYGKAV